MPKKKCPYISPCFNCVVGGDGNVLCHEIFEECETFKALKNSSE